MKICLRSLRTTANVGESEGGPGAPARAQRNETTYLWNDMIQYFTIQQKVALAAAILIMLLEDSSSACIPTIPAIGTDASTKFDAICVLAFRCNNLQISYLLNSYTCHLHCVSRKLKQELWHCEVLTNWDRFEVYLISMWISLSEETMKKLHQEEDLDNLEERIRRRLTGDTPV